MTHIRRRTLSFRRALADGGPYRAPDDMVNTLVLYDIPGRTSRQRLEALLRAHGFVWLFPYARWSSARVSKHNGLIRGVRSRLKGETYRLVLIEIMANSRTRALWLTATKPR